MTTEAAIAAKGAGKDVWNHWFTMASHLPRQARTSCSHTHWRRLVATATAGDFGVMKATE